MKKEQYNVLNNCLETRTRNDGTEFICKKDNTTTEIANLVDNVMFEHDQHSFDLNYKIMQDALICLSDVEFEKLEQFDVYEDNNEFASVYTRERLSYLNNWNQDDISTTMKDNECDDIATACAMWYDEQVREVVNSLQIEILKD